MAGRRAPLTRRASKQLTGVNVALTCIHCGGSNVLENTGKKRGALRKCADCGKWGMYGKAKEGSSGDGAETPPTKEAGNAPATAAKKRSSARADRGGAKRAAGRKTERPIQPVPSSGTGEGTALDRWAERVSRVIESIFE